ncbi:MAG TPA: hypothetical protein PKE41_08535 [Candidatus Macondimonas sp.]|nr:hypothetical protein [Candidatus Macondimonas sp.]
MRYGEISLWDKATPHRDDWGTGHRLPPVAWIVVLAMTLLAGCNSGRPPTPYITESGALSGSKDSFGFGDIFAARRDIEVHAEHDLNSPVVFKLRPGELFFAHKGFAINPEPRPLQVVRDVILDYGPGAPVTVKSGETVYYLYDYPIPDGYLVELWYRGSTYVKDVGYGEEKSSFSPPYDQARYIGEDAETRIDRIQEWIYAENIAGARGWFAFPQEAGWEYFDYTESETFADHDWLVLQPGEKQLSQQWRMDGTLSLKIKILPESESIWRLPEARGARLLINYPAATPLIVTCPQGNRSAPCQMYAFRRTLVDRGGGTSEWNERLVTASRPNAMFIGQDWMILTCNTAIDIYEWSSSCTGFGDESDELTELTVVDLRNGRSHPIIKGGDHYGRPPAFVVADRPPENLSWVSETPIEYFKDTLAITPGGFSVEVSFPDKAPGVRQRLQVALPAMNITLEPTGMDERNAPLAKKTGTAPFQAP